MLGEKSQKIKMDIVFKQTTNISMPFGPVLAGLFRLRSTRFHQLQSRMQSKAPQNSHWKDFVNQFQVKDLV